MTGETVQALLTLAIGFTVAGVFASGYQAVTQRPLSFWLLTHRARAAALAAVPLLVFAAPFIIMRNSVRGGQAERRPAALVAIATVIAGIWSVMSGTVVAAGWTELMTRLG